MLDLSIYKSRYYEVKLDENLVVNIEPPKRKQLKKVLSLTKSMSGENLNKSDIDNLYVAVQIALSKNKENKSFTAESIEDYLDLAALIAFLKAIIIGLWRMLIKKTRYSLLS